MEQPVREIDPCWDTGIGGGMQRTRNEAYRLRKQYFRLVRTADGEMEWVEKRSSISTIR